MSLGDLLSWLDAHSKPDYIWCIKRLSGNDTLANGAHQAGPYMPRKLLLKTLPDLNRRDAENPDHRFNLYIDSHSDHQLARAVWYNNKLRGGTRNETRLTRLGGESSALLDPESTGAIAIFAFGPTGGGGPVDCHVWVCQHETEEDIVEERIGPVVPGRWLVWPLPLFNDLEESTQKNCYLKKKEIPPAWFEKFPTGLEIIKKTIELRPARRRNPDKRLIERRECEFDVFRSVETAVEIPRIREGFKDMEKFLDCAQTILQRRKSRSGRSLELHVREIFLEEGLIEGQSFSYQVESEEGKKPDFLFPSIDAYKNSRFPGMNLMMLAAKTTLRDRWRQILYEADRVKTKHLLTLQEGISGRQFREITQANVKLVVPTPLVNSYAKQIRPHLMAFESFIGDVRLLGYNGNPPASS